MSLASAQPRARKLVGIVLLVFLAPVLVSDAGAQTEYDFAIARVKYGGGGDWYVGPHSVPELLAFVREHTLINVAPREEVVELSSAQLHQYPFLFLTGHGNVYFSDREARALRRYLENGGFLHIDDCYGLDPAFRRMMARVFPDKELVELAFDHPLFHIRYPFPQGPPKVHEHDGKPPQAFGIFHEGRLVVLYLYESDIHDGWEDAEVHGDPPEIREAAFRMGINIFLYALAQHSL
jgi:hypothetical protein